MNNKISKRRLSDFLAYEWIKIVLVCVVAIIVWELLYSIGSVKLTVGQKFKYYFDVNVYGENQAVNELYDNGKVLSYDVLDFSGEQLSSGTFTLPTRLYVQEGDILITDCRERAASEDGAKPQVRAKTTLDNYYGYSYEKLLLDAQNYLYNNFMVDQLDFEQAFSKYDQNNFDDEKIESVFRQRMKKDNRFRKEADIQDGIVSEKERICALYREVLDFAKLLSYKETNPELFFNYTLYEQSLETADEEYKDYFQNLYDAEVAAGRVNHIYALKVGELTKHNPNGTKTNPSKYFTMMDSSTADDVCITVFDFNSYQPHLQYETITFINAIVRDCSNLLD